MDTLKTHPGEVLREEFLVPLGITAHGLAVQLGVPATRISEIVKENRAVTADTAERLSRYFGTSAQFWLNLQNAYDLSVVIADKHDELDRIPCTFQMTGRASGGVNVARTVGVER